MTTIKDVAKYAGVSITSVSYALNGNGTISEATRKRVLTAAEMLNYHPNAFARNLKKTRTHTIGVFITRFGGSFYEEILEGIHEAILKTEYELIVCPESRPAHKILTHRQVDGAIIFDSKIQSELLLKLASSKFPIVVLDRYLQADFIFPILVDNQQGARDAFYHFYNQGARDMVFISGAKDSFDNTERTNAFIGEAQRNNLRVRCYAGNFTEESGYENAKTILSSHHFPQAVFCANDQMAIGFMKAAQEAHLRIPEDVAIIGFDDIQISKFLQPALSTIGASRLYWGSIAVTQLIDFMENGNPFQFRRIPTRLVQRASSLKTQFPA